jgi:hypothetical protein
MNKEENWVDIGNGSFTGRYAAQRGYRNVDWIKEM